MARAKFLLRTPNAASNATPASQPVRTETRSAVGHQPSQGSSRSKTAQPGERSISVAVYALFRRALLGGGYGPSPVGLFLHRPTDALSCTPRISASACGYCFYAALWAPQYPQAGNFGSRGKMGQMYLCAVAPREPLRSRNSRKYGASRIAEGQAANLRRDVLKPKHCWPVTRCSGFRAFLPRTALSRAACSGAWAGARHTSVRAAIPLLHI